MPSPPQPRAPGLHGQVGAPFQPDRARVSPRRNPRIICQVVGLGARSPPTVSQCTRRHQLAFFPLFSRAQRRSPVVPRHACRSVLVRPSSPRGNTILSLCSFRAGLRPSSRVCDLGAASPAPAGERRPSLPAVPGSGSPTFGGAREHASRTSSDAPVAPNHRQRGPLSGRKRHEEGDLFSSETPVVTRV